MTELPDPTQVYMSVISNPTTNSYLGRSTGRPVHKLHVSLANAKAAIAVRREYYRGTYFVQPGQIYHLVDNAWVLVYDVAEPTERDNLPWQS